MTDMDITIRTAKPADAEMLNKIYTYYIEKTAITFEDVALTDGEFFERMAEIMSFYPYFVAETDGEIVGYAYAAKFKNRSAYDWSVETTVYVKHEFNKKGVGSLLYAALEKALKDHGYKNMYACIAVPKVEDEYLTFGSVIFHEKSGFKTVGRFVNCGSKFGRWYGMVWMYKNIGRHVKNCARPTRFLYI